MKITILGTGSVCQTLAPILTKVGHSVRVGTRDPKATLEKTKPNHFGEPGPGVFFSSHKELPLVPLAQAADSADLVINATSGTGSLEALQAVGAHNLNGKILVDIANPLDFSHGMPPTLSVCNTDSLGEQIQKAFPETKVVKALNTMTASLMLDPLALGGGDHTVFLAGNDAGAKAVVTQFLQSFGWKDIIDLGDITASRATEMILPVWLKLWGHFGHGNLQFKIVR